jgi:hypothetical protein
MRTSVAAGNGSTRGAHHSASCRGTRRGSGERDRGEYGPTLVPAEAGWPNWQTIVGPHICPDTYQLQNRGEIPAHTRDCAGNGAQMNTTVRKFDHTGYIQRHCGLVNMEIKEKS